VESGEFFEKILAKNFEIISELAFSTLNRSGGPVK